MNNGLLHEAGKFLTVGVANTVIGLLIIYAAKWFLQLGDVAANALGYSVGLLISFALHSRWTFGYLGSHLHALAKFLLVALVAYGVNLLTVVIAIQYFNLNSYVAQAMGIPTYTLTSFFANKYFVFRTKPWTSERR